MNNHPLMYDWVRVEHERRINTVRHEVPRAARKAARRSSGHRLTLRSVASSSATC